MLNEMSWPSYLTGIIILANVMQIDQPVLPLQNGQFWHCAKGWQNEQTLKLVCMHVFFCFIKVPVLEPERPNSQGNPG